MSDDELNALVALLKNTPHTSLTGAAADAIVALLAERRELHEKLQNVEYSWMIKVKERDDAYEENARLIAEVQAGHDRTDRWQDRYQDEADRAEKAETEVARLKRRLEELGHAE
jgi:predicted nuclease with TOPRIM domain